MIERSERHRVFVRRLLKAMSLSSLLGVTVAGCMGQTDAGGALQSSDDFTCGNKMPNPSVTGQKLTLKFACFPESGGACPSATDASVAPAIAQALGVCDEASGPLGSCCDKEALTQVLCGPDPSTAQGCCYYGAVEAFGFCGTGRPFYVAGEARAASAERRSGWGALAAPGVEALDPPTRQALARAWTRDARYEHASVASFARLALELLAVGAPADLVRDAQRAMGDEIRHAELCFALAGAYSGERVGPGPLPMDGVLGRASLAAIAAAAVTEGCVGETIAALCAAEALAAAEDPAARAALEVIAVDEAEHAESAWRLVSWAYRTGSAEVRAAIGEAFAAPPAGFAEAALPGEEGIDKAAFRAHGCLMPGDVQAIAARAITEVVRPAAETLLVLEA